ncbi:CatA-like O-acetyltransferase [uncultured Oscillibacter sp.]|uniref:CatA-like O-acetyltransferase n=1 Tax=uncultured Oscillibacter sp. TaxID=876091 RepID=UPI0025D8E76C|nr:CatA-like O-acetyltransferase [uncultured Oscillibacter sp.]
MTRIVDRAAWSRRELFDFFSPMSQPFFSVTFRQDVTRLYAFTKESGLSFYYSLVYLCTQAVNQVEAFRYALRGEDLVLFDRRLPSFTDLKPGAEQFHIVTLPCEGTIRDFCAAAKAKSAAQNTFLDQEDSLDLIYFSCLPWVELTALTNERDFDPNDAVPRIAWGKYAQEGERKVLHISLELNHRFVDGLHVGRFHEALSAGIEAL